MGQRERERKRAQRERKGAARERGRGQRKMRERAMGSDTYIWDKSILAFVNLTVTKLYTVRLNPSYFCVRFVLLLYRNKAKTIIYS